MPRDDSHANLYSGNVTLLPFVSEDEEDQDQDDATGRDGEDGDEDDDEPFEGTNFESVIAPFVHWSRGVVTRGIFWGAPNKGRALGGMKVELLSRNKSEGGCDEEDPHEPRYDLCDST